jgi:hypothetical protein
MRVGSKVRRHDDRVLLPDDIHDERLGLLAEIERATWAMPHRLIPSSTTSDKPLGDSLNRDSHMRERTDTYARKRRTLVIVLALPAEQHDHPASDASNRLGETILETGVEPADRVRVRVRVWMNSLPATSSAKLYMTTSMRN